MNIEDANDLQKDLDEILSVGEDGFGTDVTYLEFNDVTRTNVEEFYKERVSLEYKTGVKIEGYFVINVTVESIGYTGGETLDKSALIVSKTVKENKMPNLSIKDIIEYDGNYYRMLRSPFPLKFGNYIVAYILNFEKTEDTINES